jgi:hypothetical protein
MGFNAVCAWVAMVAEQTVSKGKKPQRSAAVCAAQRLCLHGSASVIAIVGSALLCSLWPSFSACVSTRSILLLPLPLLWCEWKLKVLFALGLCWPGGAGSGCAVEDIISDVLTISSFSQT